MSKKSIYEALDEVKKFETTQKELSDVAKKFKKNEKTLDTLRLGYLKDFAKNYDKIKNEGLNTEKLTKEDIESESQTPTKKIIDSITFNAKSDEKKKASLQKVANDIASGKSKSLGSDAIATPFTLTVNIGVMVTGTGDAYDRTKRGVINNLESAFGKSTEDTTKIVETLEKQYPSILGVIGKSDDLQSLKQDMGTIINHGSEGEPNHAARYVEMQKFEKEVKDKVKEYVQRGTIEGPEAKAYLNKKSIEALGYLKSDYENNLITAKEGKEAKFKSIDDEIARLKKDAKSLPVHKEQSTEPIKKVTKVVRFAEKPDEIKQNENLRWKSATPNTQKPRSFPDNMSRDLKAGLNSIKSKLNKPKEEKEKTWVAPTKKRQNTRY